VSGQRTRALAAAVDASFEALARASARRYTDAPDDATPVPRWLAFELGSDAYAVPLECVREIVPMRPITPVPRAPRALRGVVALRGEIVQVIDLRLRLGLAPIEPTRASRIVVVQFGDDRAAGLLVDGVTDVLRVREDEIRPTGGTESSAIQALCLRDRAFVSLIDPKRVFELGEPG
jgi:purine-binding chemotaxis protein CheW